MCNLVLNLFSYKADHAGFVKSDQEQHTVSGEHCNWQFLWMTINYKISLPFEELLTIDIRSLHILFSSRKDIWLSQATGLEISRIL